MAFEKLDRLGTELPLSSQAEQLHDRLLAETPRVQDAGEIDALAPDGLNHAFERVVEEREQVFPTIDHDVQLLTAPRRHRFLTEFRDRDVGAIDLDRSVGLHEHFDTSIDRDGDRWTDRFEGHRKRVDDRHRLHCVLEHLTDPLEHLTPRLQPVDTVIHLTALLQRTEVFRQLPGRLEERALGLAEKLFDRQCGDQPAPPFLNHYRPPPSQSFDSLVDVRSGASDQLPDPVSGRGLQRQQSEVHLRFELVQAEPAQVLQFVRHRRSISLYYFDASGDPGGGDPARTAAACFAPGQADRDEGVTRYRSASIISVSKSAASSRNRSPGSDVGVPSIARIGESRERLLVRNDPFIRSSRSRPR